MPSILFLFFLAVTGLTTGILYSRRNNGVYLSGPKDREYPAEHDHSWLIGRFRDLSISPPTGYPSIGRNLFVNYTPTEDLLTARLGDFVAEAKDVLLEDGIKVKVYDNKVVEIVVTNCSQRFGTKHGAITTGFVKGLFDTYGPKAVRALRETTVR